MTPKGFVAELAAVSLPNVFNPYSDKCPFHDRTNAAALRRRNLRGYLEALERIGTDTVWMGRDLGYRGGRRTGLALTDEARLAYMGRVFPGTTPVKATHGELVAERTAAEVWAILAQVSNPPLLWNVFPFHPHEDGEPLSNRKFSSTELRQVIDINVELLSWLGIKRVVALGQDAADYAGAMRYAVIKVRHPSYGGTAEFRRGLRDLYGLPALPPARGSSDQAHLDL